MLTRNHSILIVDNVSDRRQQLKAMLFERDDTILEAETSEAALDLMKESPVDLIITETELSTRSGLYLLQEVKKHYPETEVILTTHNASSFNLLQALRHGAFDFIVRPIDTSEILFNVIDKAFTQIDLRVQNQSLMAELAHRNQEMERSLAMMTALSEAIEKINSAMEVSELLSRLLRLRAGRTARPERAAGTDLRPRPEPLRHQDESWCFRRVRAEVYRQALRRSPA